MGSNPRFGPLSWIGRGFMGSNPRFGPFSWIGRGFRLGCSLYAASVSCRKWEPPARLTANSSLLAPSGLTVVRHTPRRLGYSLYAASVSCRKWEPPARLTANSSLLAPPGLTVVRHTPACRTAAPLAAQRLPHIPISSIPSAAYRLRLQPERAERAVSGACGSGDGRGGG